MCTSPSGYLLNHLSPPSLHLVSKSVEYSLPSRLRSRSVSPTCTPFSSLGERNLSSVHTAKWLVNTLRYYAWTHFISSSCLNKSECFAQFFWRAITVTQNEVLARGLHPIVLNAATLVALSFLSSTLYH